MTDLIAANTSFTAAMLFFAAVNAAILVLTLLFVPAMPAPEALSYGAYGLLFLTGGQLTAAALAAGFAVTALKPAQDKPSVLGGEIKEVNYVGA